jgi:ABC-type antimicrobial peptide transport system permease subunit
VPTVYVNALQERDGYPSFIVRTNGDPMRYVGAIKAAIAELDPSLPVDGIRTMESALGQPLVKSRFSSQLLSSFALLALVVATVGVFGMTAFMVAQRTQEIGVRIAMGARPVDVLRMVLRQALQVGGIGVAVGIACSLAVRRLVSRLLFGIGAADPLTFVTSAAGLLIVVLLACAVPARRASRIDPAVTLRAP